MSADIIEKSGLSHFERAGLVKSSNQDPKTYRYQPSSTELRDAADQALNAYTNQRVQVIGIIFAAPIQNFSDAFKLRQEDDL